MAEGDLSASAAQARSLSGSKHIGQWLLQRSGELTLAWFCLVYTRACELLTLVQVVHWLVSVMFLQTCLTGGVLTCLGMFVCLAQVVHWPVWSCLSKPVESSGGYFTWPTDMFISCLTD